LGQQPATCRPCATTATTPLKMKRRYRLLRLHYVHCPTPSWSVRQYHTTLFKSLDFGTKLSYFLKIKKKTEKYFFCFKKENKKIVAGRECGTMRDFPGLNIVATSSKPQRVPLPPGFSLLIHSRSPTVIPHLSTTHPHVRSIHHTTALEYTYGKHVVMCFFFLPINIENRNVFEKKLRV
jgi:hypothetical protein